MRESAAASLHRRFAVSHSAHMHKVLVGCHAAHHVSTLWQLLDLSERNPPRQILLGTDKDCLGMSGVSTTISWCMPQLPTEMPWSSLLLHKYRHMGGGMRTSSACGGVTARW